MSHVMTPQENARHEQTPRRIKNWPDSINDTMPFDLNPFEISVELNLHRQR
jgi:hypothetical protein